MDSAILWWWLDSGGWLIGSVWSRERERERWKKKSGERKKYKIMKYIVIVVKAKIV